MIVFAEQNKAMDRAASVREKVLATRPMFLTASVLPVLAGYGIGYQVTGTIEYLPLMLALASIVCVNLAINVYNDVYDDINGTDKLNTRAIVPFTGGSRAIQNQVFTRNQMRRIGHALLVLSMLFGFGLFLIKGYWILVFGMLGIFTGIAYSVPPFALANRGMGEIAICFGVGLLPVMGATWLQTGEMEFSAIPVALAIGLWVMNIILVNEVPDRQADKAAGKRTLVVRMANSIIVFIYLLSGLLAVFLLSVFVEQNNISPGILLLPLVLLVSSIYAAFAIARYDQNPAWLLNGIKLTIASHTLNCLWITAWLFML